jgi:hypothetical protein
MQDPLPAVPWWLRSMRGVLQRCVREAREGIARPGRKGRDAELSGTCKGCGAGTGGGDDPSPPPRTRAWGEAALCKAVAVAVAKNPRYWPSRPPFMVLVHVPVPLTRMPPIHSFPMHPHSLICKYCSLAVLQYWSIAARQLERDTTRWSGQHSQQKHGSTATLNLLRPAS